MFLPFVEGQASVGFCDLRKQLIKKSFGAVALLLVKDRGYMGCLQRYV